MWPPRAAQQRGNLNPKARRDGDAYSQEKDHRMKPNEIQDHRARQDQLVADSQKTMDGASAKKRDLNRRAAANAYRIWAQLPKTGYSAYLACKKIHGFGCRYAKK